MKDLVWSLDKRAGNYSWKLWQAITRFSLGRAGALERKLQTMVNGFLEEFSGSNGSMNALETAETLLVINDSQFLGRYTLYGPLPEGEGDLHVA